MQVIASTDPKPVPGDWSGNGAPVKFSTRETREEGKGWFVIQEHLRRLQQVRAQARLAHPSCAASTHHAVCRERQIEHQNLEAIRMSTVLPAVASYAP